MPTRWLRGEAELGSRAATRFFWGGGFALLGRGPQDPRERIQAFTALCASPPIRQEGDSVGCSAAVKQLGAMIGEDLLPLGRRESEAISGYAELEQQSQRQKRPACESSWLIAAVLRAGA